MADEKRAVAAARVVKTCITLAVEMTLITEEDWKVG